MHTADHAVSGHVFLSHAGEDSHDAQVLADFLRVHGLDVWFDRDCLKEGELWQQQIEAAIKSAAAMVVYVGRRGVVDWIDREVRYGLVRNIESDGAFRLIAVLTPEANAASLPPFVAQHQWVSSEPAGAARLVEALRADSRGVTGTIARWATESPFRGLKEFTADDGWLFFGRDQQVDDLLARMEHTPLVPVVGNSGSGKSSLLRAGLIPALRRGRFHVNGQWIDSWRIAVCRPTSDPFNALAAMIPKQIAPRLSDADVSNCIQKLTRSLPNGGTALRDAIPTLLGAELPSSPDMRLLLVIDQFEEIFTQTTDPNIRGRYIDLLLNAANVRGVVPTHVVLVLRADFFGRCLDHPGLGKVLEHALSMPLMTPDQMNDGIRNRLRFARGRAELGLIDAMLRDVSSQPGNLALLEHALSELWKRTDGPSRTLTHAAYYAIGGLHGALSSHADRVYSEFAPAEQVVVQQIFLGLVDLVYDEEAKTTVLSRRRLPLESLLHLGPPEVLEQLIVRLASGRLITTGVSAPGSRASIEISHDLLIREWPCIGEWAEAHQDNLRMVRELESAAKEWRRERERGETGFLLTGLKLTRADEWLRDHPAPVPVPEFVARSRQEDERARRTAAERTAKLTRRFAVVALTLLLVAGAVAAVAVVQSHKAVEARRLALARQLSAEARLLLQGGFNKVPLAALLTVESIRRERLLEADIALRQLLAFSGRRSALLKIEAPPVSLRLMNDGGQLVFATATTLGATVDIPSGKISRGGIQISGELTQVSLSPDGTMAAGIDQANGRVKLFDTGSGALVLDVPANGAVYRLALAPDARRLAVADSRAIWIVEAGPDEMPLTLASFAAPGVDLSFSPDGRLLAVRADGVSGWVRVFDALTGREVLGYIPPAPVFLQPFTKSNAVAFAPRGDRIAIAGSTTQIVDLTTGKAVADITTGAEGTSLAYSADGARLVVGAADGSVILADAANGQALLKYQLHDRRVVAVRVDAQARRILSVGADSSGAGNGTVVDVVSQQPLTIVPNETAVLDAAMSSGDTATATMAYADGSIRTVDLTPSADRVSLSAGIGINRTVLLNHAEKAAVFNVVSILPSLAVFDASTGAELSKRRVTYSIADISRDGRFIAARERAGLKILDASDERQILSFDHGSPTRIYFSWDGLRVFTVNDDDKKVRVVQTLTGAILKEVLVDAFAEEPTFAPDGRRVAFAAGRRVHLLGFDGSGDAEIRRNETSGPVSFSADSAVLFVGDGITLRLVDVLRGNDRRSVPLQTTVLRLATSPDEAWIAAACSDGTVRLIDATTGQIVSQIEAPGEIQALAFDRTGRSIRIAQQQSIGIVLRTFPVALDDLVSETCARLSRNLTESEWRQYLAGEPYRPTCTLPEVVTVHTSRQ